MVCFNGPRADLFVRTLAAIQLGLKAFTVAAAALGIASAASEKNNGTSSDSQCECILKTKPLHCQLITLSGDKDEPSLWDPLFILVCFWLGLVTLLSIFRDFRFGVSRVTNATLFFIVGSIFGAMGDHYERDQIFVLGIFLTFFSFFLYISIPIWGRSRTTEIDAESRLLDSGNNDEFGQSGTGVFSSLD